MSVLDKYSCEGQMSLFDPDTWCGRMCQVPSQVTKEQISKPSLKKQPKWQKGMPAYLDLRAESGPAQDASWEMGGALLGEYTMRSFGEYPSEENVSLLSQILEDNPHPKYCLSPKACQGILRRAEKRGKKLPELLERTLIKQSAFKNELESQGGAREYSYNMSEQEPCPHSTTKVYCLQGNGIDRADTAGCNGKGWREDQSYTLNTIDRPAVLSVDEKMGQTYIGEEVGNTLGARDYKQPQAVCVGNGQLNQISMSE